MHLSPARLIVAFALSAAIRLATLYLKRLDAKEESGPPAERAAIRASRRRAQGHLWLLGALMSSIAIFVLLFGVNRPGLGLGIVAGVTALALVDTFCIRKMLNAYAGSRTSLSAS